MKRISGLIIFLALSLNLFAQSWNLKKENSKLSFKVNTFGFAGVEGDFKEFASSFDAQREDFTDAKITLTIRAKSLDTDNNKRDNHLRSEDYFEVEKYPEIFFTSTNLKKIKDKKYLLTGNLKIRGVEKVVSIDVDLIRVSEDRKTAIFAISGKINRSDFDFGKGAMETIMSDEVRISGKVEYVRK